LTTDEQGLTWPTDEAESTLPDERDRRNKNTLIRMRRDIKCLSLKVSEKTASLSCIKQERMQTIELTKQRSRAGSYFRLL
jgi:hypothetical protein